MQVKLLLFTFYLNGGFPAVSMGKPSEQMSNFWTVQFLKNQISVFRTSLMSTVSPKYNRPFSHLHVSTLAFVPSPNVDIHKKINFVM